MATADVRHRTNDENFDDPVSGAIRKTININDNAVQKFNKIWFGILFRYCLECKNKYVIMQLQLFEIKHITGFGLWRE